MYKLDNKRYNKEPVPSYGTGDLKITHIEKTFFRLRKITSLATPSKTTTPEMISPTKSPGNNTNISADPFLPILVSH